MLVFRARVECVNRKNLKINKKPLSILNGENPSQNFL